MVISYGIGPKRSRRRNRWDAAASTPSALALTVISNTQINGTFTINGTGQDGHKVYISSDGGATYSLNQTLTGADNTFSATGLTAGTLYYFYVKAYKGVSESSASNIANAQLPNNAEIVIYTSGLSTPISEREESLIDDFVTLLKTKVSATNLSDVFDVIAICEGETSEQSLRNLVKDAHHSTLEGASNPTFEKYEGFVGNATTGYINIHYKPATQTDNVSQNSICVGVLSYKSLSVSSKALIGAIDGSSVGISIAPFISGNKTAVRCNSAVNSSTVATGSKGFHLINRTASDKFGVYKDAALKYEPSVASAALIDVELSALARNNNGTQDSFNDDKIAFYFIGRGLTSGEVTGVFEAFDWLHSNRFATVDIDQLSVHIDAQNGNKLFGYDVSTQKIFYSPDNGANYTYKDFTDAQYIGMSYVFNNGNILFCTGTHAYLSTDGLLTYNEISVYDQNGDAFPFVAGGNNMVNVRLVDSQVLGNGKQMIVWGAYVNAGFNCYVALFYSIDGESVKTAYMFGQNATYGSYGDPTNTVIARHIHSACYSSVTGNWYWNTGDAGSDPDYECHLFESSYNYLTDAWSHTKLLSGDDSTHIKAGALYYDDGNIYFGSDNTSGDMTAERGMWKVAEGDLGTLLSHTKITDFNEWILGGHIVTDKYGLVFPAGYTITDNKYYLGVYDKATPANQQLRWFYPLPAGTYYAWKLIKLSDTVFLANYMDSTEKYLGNTIKVTITEGT